MKSYKNMPLDVSVRLRYLQKDKRIKVCELANMRTFSCYSKSYVYIHAKLWINSLSLTVSRRRLLTVGNKRKFVRAIIKLRRTEGSFSARRL